MWPDPVTTAELVVDVLSPGERAGEKLPFYASRNVKEYLEVDLAARSVRLLMHRGGEWVPVDRSGVIDLTTTEVLALLPD